MMHFSAMQTWRPRETRRTVRLSVRVRTDDGWVDAVVRNVSERGMSLHSLHPLRRNQFIEIARGRCRVVGRIVWSEDAACGVRAQDAVDIAGFLAGPGEASAARTNDRRMGDRAAHAAPLAPPQRHPEHARWVGRAFEFGVVLAGIASTAAIAADGVLEVLSAPLQQVNLALAAAPG
jgi:hypothetical protein